MPRVRTLWSRTRSPSQAMPLDAYGTEDAVAIPAAVPSMRPVAYALDAGAGAEETSDTFP